MLYKLYALIMRMPRWLWIPFLGAASGVRAAFDPDLPSDFNIAIPTTQIDDIGDFYNVVCSATGWIVVFGILIGAAFVVWGGVRYITSGGDDSKAGDAKSTIKTAIIGIVFLLLAVALIRIIASFFGSTSLSTFDLITC